jgi:hypothetical protein
LGAELKEGLSNPLAQVIERINLLGHTHSVCEAEFAALAEFNGFDATTFSFADLRAKPCQPLTSARCRRITAMGPGFWQILPARNPSAAWP